MVNIYQKVRKAMKKEASFGENTLSAKKRKLYEPVNINEIMILA